jgi:ABC-type nitrate/sulfonate/bicarbonate transport system substrate-binding protein
MIGHFALAACLTLAGMAVIGAQSASAQDKITVGIIPITDCAPIFLGKQKGFYNLDVNIESAQGALTHGSFAAACNSASPSPGRWPTSRMSC